MPRQNILPLYFATNSCVSSRPRAKHSHARTTHQTSTCQSSRYSPVFYLDHPSNNPTLCTPLRREIKGRLVFIKILLKRSLYSMPRMVLGYTFLRHASKLSPLYLPTRPTHPSSKKTRMTRQNLPPLNLAINSCVSCNLPRNSKGSPASLPDIAEKTWIAFLNAPWQSSRHSAISSA